MIGGRLIEAAKRGDTNEVRRLLDKEFVRSTDLSIIHTRDGCGNTSLMWACARGHTQIIRLFLLRASSQAGKNRDSIINAKNNKGDTALHFATRNGHLEAACMLLGFQSDVFVANSRGETPANVAKDLCRKKIDWKEFARSQKITPTSWSKAVCGTELVAATSAHDLSSRRTVNGRGDSTIAARLDKMESQLQTLLVRRELDHTKNLELCEKLDFIISALKNASEQEEKATLAKNEVTDSHADNADGTSSEDDFEVISTNSA